jgi:hypothetical protein
LHSAGGVCLIVGDELYFYFGAWSGISPRLDGHMYAGGSTGVAMLRRDGFASLDAGAAGGVVTTRPVLFRGGHLFVNCNVPHGELRAEVLNEDGKSIGSFAAADCIPVRANKTCQVITWKGEASLSTLNDRPVRVRFLLRDGELYSFWVTPDRNGASHGFTAAGGPGFTGPTDTVGDGTTA